MFAVGQNNNQQQTSTTSCNFALAYLPYHVLQYEVILVGGPICLLTYRPGTAMYVYEVIMYRNRSIGRIHFADDNKYRGGPPKARIVQKQLKE